MELNSLLISFTLLLGLYFARAKPAHSCLKLHKTYRGALCNASVDKCESPNDPFGLVKSFRVLSNSQSPNFVCKGGTLCCLSLSPPSVTIVQHIGGRFVWECLSTPSFFSATGEAC
jgi:hypothetical protein